MPTPHASDADFLSFISSQLSTPTCPLEKWALARLCRLARRYDEAEKWSTQISLRPYTNLHEYVRKLLREAYRAPKKETTQ